MEPNWTEVLKTLGSTAVIVLTIGFVGRSIFKAWLDRNLENHKKELERQSERELEHLRLSLRIEEMKQSRLLARQAQIIAKVYARLERLDQALTKLASPLYHAQTSVNELKEKAITEFNAFGSYYFERGIWLDKDTCNAINEIQAEMHKLLTSFNYNVDAQGVISNRAAWVESFKAVREEIPNARALLDKRFRSLLGVAEAKL